MDNNNSQISNNGISIEDEYSRFLINMLVDKHITLTIHFDIVSEGCSRFFRAVISDFQSEQVFKKESLIELKKEIEHYIMNL